ncbi:MAG: hypothetical protein Q8L99_04590 [Polycyclovorans sp.]|nr:hypothetical protein [Polycyclovorans sp.]
MRNQGLSINTGLNSFLQGFETGERIKARKDEKEWAGEQRQRQRQEWRRADTDQIKVDALNQLGGIYEAAQGGLDVDPAEFESVTQKLSTAGIQLPKYGNPKMQQWIQSGQQALKTGRLDEPTLELLNWRFAEDVAKGVGNVFEADTQVTQDLKLPKGSKIVGKRIARMDMAPDKSGLAAGLEVTVQTPDGKKVTYLAPATENRTSNDDDPVKIIPLDQMMDTLKGDQILYQGIQQSPAAIRSYMARLGKPPEPEKVEVKSFQQGDETVTATIGPDGQVRQELGRGTLGAVRAAQVRAQAAREKASGGLSDAAPYYTPVQTSQGLVRFDARSGTYEPMVGADGAQLLPPAIDPRAQGEVAAAKSSGTARGKYEGSQPKVLSTLKATESKTDRMVGEIDRALAMVDGTTTGFAGSMMTRFPGTKAKNLQRVIDSIKANIGFAELNEMRANSPTGGALGNVTERELAFLQSVISSLEQDQSPDQLRENLGNVRSAVLGSRERLRQAYEADFGEAQQGGQPMQGAPAVEPASPRPQQRPPLSAFGG